MPSRNDGGYRRSSYDADRDRKYRSNHRRRDKERDTSPPRPRSSERPAYHSFRRTNSSTASSSSYRRPRRRSSTRSDTSRERARRKVYNVEDPGMERRASTSHLPGTRSNSTPYPSFSKAHSREAVVPSGEQHSSSGPRSSSYNLTPTGSSSPTKGAYGSANESSTKRPYSNSAEPKQNERQSTSNQDIRKVHSRGSIRSDNGYTSRDMHDYNRRDDSSQQQEPEPVFSASQSSLRNAEEGRTSSSTKPRITSTTSNSLRPRAASQVGAVSPTKSPERSRELPSRAKSASHRSALSHPTDSDATSVAPDRKRSGHPPTLLSHRDTSPSSDPDSFPRTPNGHDALSTVPDDKKEAPVVEVYESSQLEADFGQSPQIAPGREIPQQPAPPPPPPPPPPLDTATPSEIPKVDYLLRNGGLNHTVSKRFINAPYPSNSNTYHHYSSPPQPPTPKAPDGTIAFAPYKTFLDDLENVLSQKGSIAVATGYKSISRRLVDRLESVFGRNISSQFCSCIICTSDRQAQKSGTDTKVSWGEVFELVTGRRELPPWPPFQLPTASTGLGLSGFSQKAPMQKLDVDVPEEYREHYIRQSKKTKQAVDKWLAGQPEDQRNPPAEVDDETLVFAMLTYLDPSDRPTFTALVRGLSFIPDMRSPTPAPTEPKSELLSNVGTALQRLHRLPRKPRDPESSMYLLKHPELHNSLATLASISNDEWEIMVSGRFDAYLVPGAETQFQSMGPVPSRGPTPLRRSSATPASSFQSSTNSPRVPKQTPLRNATGNAASSPAQSPLAPPGPAQVDEETEIAVLAEVEREIYTGMEALEDAFELLHVKAETIRRGLRERGAALSMSARMNYNGSATELDARLGTPFDGEAAAGSFEGTPSGGLRAGSAWGNWPPINTPSQRESTAGMNFPDVSDDGLDDVASLVPDDSASNIGWREKSKHRYHRRRRPRRTPAPVDEGDE